MDAPTLAEDVILIRRQFARAVLKGSTASREADGAEGDVPGKGAPVSGEPSPIWVNAAAVKRIARKVDGFELFDRGGDRLGNTRWYSSTFEEHLEAPVSKSRSAPDQARPGTECPVIAHPSP